MTALPTYAGLVEDLEREDDERGYEEEPEGAFVQDVLAAIGAIAAGVLPVCRQCWCGHPMTPTGGDHWVCQSCHSEYQGPGGAVEVPRPEAAEIGAGYCGNCGEPVSTLDGRYACTSCGYCN
ncbi:hypothetical protein [Streptomyces rugosispiralis]|uniref:Uncharacterized protein n=1 Tax=Streptomyces rugosispiralis TaxID=2967341 RepID=A0ABT1VDD6_9ACTN|nr:hypothetical protein [Streptomyces rugosispiralis]MCQ8195422.1 hypothetical protein [Streptomyces rugosispiralis]